MTTRSIYIVDDDDAVRASLHSLLSVRPDTLIRGYKSGDAFLAAMDELEPGCLLLDFHMPGATGLDVLNAIRDKPRFTAVILTGRGDVNLAVQAMKAGAHDFIEKPYQFEELSTALATAFDISPRTVEIYRANVMTKLGVKSLSEALRIAFAAGLVPEN